MLAFQHGGTERNFAWYDREGHELGAVSLPTVLFNPRVSPDESRLVATSSLTHEPGLWLASLARAEYARLATDAIGPLWSPDGRRVAFTARGGTELLVRALDSGAPPQILLSDGTIKILNDWSPNGADLVYTRADDTSVDLWIADARDRRARPLLTTPFNEMQARLSPDGQWIAYASDESGVLEVYVQRYPDLGEKRLVSVRGGGQPQWRADQRELFYLSADRAVMSVEVNARADVLTFGAPRALFRPAIAGSPADARDHYAATADGRKFLVDGAAQTGNDAAITVIVNWAAGAVEPPPTAANRMEGAARLLR